MGTERSFRLQLNATRAKILAGGVTASLLAPDILRPKSSLNKPLEMVIAAGSAAWTLNQIRRATRIRIQQEEPTAEEICNNPEAYPFRGMDAVFGNPTVIDQHGTIVYKLNYERNVRNARRNAQYKLREYQEFLHKNKERTHYPTYNPLCAPEADVVEVFTHADRVVSKCIMKALTGQQMEPPLLARDENGNFPIDDEQRAATHWKGISACMYRLEPFAHTKVALLFDREHRKSFKQERLLLYR